MSRERRELGGAGEAHAAAHLSRLGYRILDRNVRAGGVEIDIVARRLDLIVFVEVKTRRSRRFGAPELAVDARKCARILRGAGAWLRERRTGASRIRFDVISCEVDAAGDWKLRHLEGAFDGND